MEKPILDPLPTWLQRAWLQLRSALFIGTVAAGFVIGALKAWREAFPLATKEDVAAVADGVKQMSNEQLRDAIDSTAGAMVQDAMGRMRAENDSLFTALVRDVVEPGIERQNKLMREVKRLNEMMGVNSTMLEEQGKRTAQAGDRLEELRNMMQNGDASGQILELLREVQSDQDRIKKKLKIETRSF